MKKFIAALLTLVTLLSVSAASAQSLAGGWCIADSTAITEENKALFDKALDGLLGVEYVPIAYLGNQVVAGLNHCFLCKATVVYPDATPTLVLVYIHEGLDGRAEITRIADLDIAALATAAE